MLTIRFATEHSAKSLTHSLYLLSEHDLENRLAAILSDKQLDPSYVLSDFKAQKKQVWTSLYHQNKRIYLIGLGKNPKAMDFENAIKSFVIANKNTLNGLVLDLQNQDFEVLERSLSACYLGLYDLGLLKTDYKKADEPILENIEVLVTDLEIAQKALQKAQIIKDAQLNIMDLVNLPANHVTPQTLASHAVDLGKKYDLNVKIFHKPDLEKLQMGSLLAVGQGSELPPLLIEMEYKPKKAGNYPKIALVGKAVTFDTGGLSIKTSKGMYYMKTDMTGGATVLSIIEAAARLELPVHLLAFVPATENAVDAKSVRPSDIVRSYSGISVEIVDTDAEGRLILSDALSYAIKNYQPDVVFDFATLTGSIIATLGYVAAGIFSQNDELAQKISLSSQKTGEKVWRLPMWEDYESGLHSDVADVRNYHGEPFAGAISAAKFLEVFTDKHPAWLHFDIAGVAAKDTEYGRFKNATGFGLRLMLDYLENL